MSGRDAISEILTVKRQTTSIPLLHLTECELVDGSAPGTPAVTGYLFRCSFGIFLADTTG